MFDKVDIKTYLTQSFRKIILGALVMFGVSAVGVLFIFISFNNLANHINVATNAAKECALEANVAGRLLREMVLDVESTDYGAYIEKMDAAVADIDAAVESFKNSGVSNQATVDEYENTLNNWLTIGKKVAAEIQAGNDEVARVMLLEECSPALASILNLTDSIEQEMELKSSAAVRNVIISIFLVIAISLIVVIVIIRISAKIAGSVTDNMTNAISKIKTAVEQLSVGKLDTHIDYEADNEFGELSGTLNFCFDELARYVNAIKDTMSDFARGKMYIENDVQFRGDFISIRHSMDEFSKNISQTLSGILEASYDVSEHSEQIASTSQCVAEGATEQSSDIQELSNTIEEMTNQVDTTADHMREINNLMQDTITTIKDSEEKMDEVRDAMQDIKDKSEDIQSIVATIDSISSQTNLLSLNASIEAARAGESGKGFAVVAGEVSQLAKQSAEAAKDIANLISATIAAVERGGEKVENAADALETVVRQSEEVTEKVAAVGEVAEVEAQEMRQMLKGVNHLASVVQDNTASSEQSAAASIELSDRAGKMSEMINQFDIGV